MARINFAPWLFLAPALLICGFFGGVPIVQSLILSLHDQTGIGAPATFVGLQNYLDLMQDRYFQDAFRNTLIWMAAFVVGVPSLATLLAVLLNSNSWFESLCKTVLFLPIALSFSVIGIIWQWIYQPRIGLLDQALTTLGMGGLVQAWLGPDLGLASVIIAAAWTQTSFSIVIVLAGLSGISRELVEAARVDGANGWTMFWRITLPLLRPAMMIVVSSALIAALQSTEIVLTMTKGGPFGTTDVLGYRMYIETFWNYRFGYGAAVGVIITLITATFVLPYLRRMISLQERDLR
ncbi:MAG TPA: sugar ABC transporter permease [Devosiaceae bacterium]|jgi:ABC-type sugar transport system permease subunit|nr:sugar ABC transporter permease [Devosiaceae bacterium]